MSLGGSCWERERETERESGRERDGGKRKHSLYCVLLIFSRKWCCYIAQRGKLKINRSDNDNNSNDAIKCRGANDISEYDEWSRAWSIVLFCFLISLSAQLSMPVFNLFLISFFSFAPHKLVAPQCSLKMENTGKAVQPGLLLLGPLLSSLMGCWK